ncbi:hypothetical protein [Anabaena sp. CA = ATCC 33047]|uniref:hypothetical protein n=1 Tax=Anabaena sp. (strain CA / ATCC 33047) TaxID=52271 RepID=UPI000832C1A1|nr:hypothetical protein [Anabaena sp. CA = ATCC 33047]
MKLQNIAASVALAVTLPTLSFSGSHTALAATQQIPAGTVAQILNKGLSVSGIYLNSYGSQQGNSWHKANDSYVNIYGYTQKFNIPEFSYKGAVLKRRLYVYNVKSIKSQKITIEPQSNAFQLDIKFENKGSEIKGMCRYKKLGGGYRDCIREDGAAPDINWKNPGIKVRLTPQAHKGGIILKPVSVDVQGEFQMNGICKIGKDICDRFTGYKSKIKNSVASSVMNQLNSNTVKNQMANVSRQGLSQLNIPPVKSVTMSGGYVKIEF